MDTVMGRRCLFKIEDNLGTNLTITNTCRNTLLLDPDGAATTSTRCGHFE